MLYIHIPNNKHIPSLPSPPSLLGALLLLPPAVEQAEGLSPARQDDEVGPRPQEGAHRHEGQHREQARGGVGLAGLIVLVLNAVTNAQHPHLFPGRAVRLFLRT